MPLSLKSICVWISILPTTRTLLQRGDSNLKSKQKVFEWNQKNMYAVFRFPGIVVQLVRAPPCQGGSCGFEPRQSRPRIQWIDQFISPFSVKSKRVQLPPMKCLGEGLGLSKQDRNRRSPFMVLVACFTGNLRQPLIFLIFFSSNQKERQLSDLQTVELQSSCSLLRLLPLLYL